MPLTYHPCPAQANFVWNQHEDYFFTAAPSSILLDDERALVMHDHKLSKFGVRRSKQAAARVHNLLHPQPTTGIAEVAKDEHMPTSSTRGASRTIDRAMPPLQAGIPPRGRGQAPAGESSVDVPSCRKLTVAGTVAIIAVACVMVPSIPHLFNVARESLAFYLIVSYFVPAIVLACLFAWYYDYISVERIRADRVGGGTLSAMQMRTWFSGPVIKKLSLGFIKSMSPKCATTDAWMQIHSVDVRLLVYAIAD